jgi:hypothetical protein
MPTEQPNTAPDQLTPRDGDTAADVLHDEALDTGPGGGGLGPRSGNTGRTPHGTAPNAPVDTGLAAAEPTAEARRQASDAS